MRDRRKRNIVIGTLACLLVFMGVGYAILSKTFNLSGVAYIKGNWDIYIYSIEAIPNSTKAVSKSATVTDKLNANFEIEFHTPGEYVEYNVVVKNGGNINASLEDVKTEITGRNDLVSMTTDARKNKTLKAGEQETIKVRIEYKESATELPNQGTAEYKLTLYYVQSSDFNIGPSGEVCFNVSEEGTLTKYSSSCGTDVVVPESVEGINITTIGAGAFGDVNLEVYYDATNNTYVGFIPDEAARTQVLKNVDVAEMVNSGLTLNVKSELTEAEYIALIPTGSDVQKMNFYVDDNGNMVLGGQAFLTSLDLSNATYLTTIEDNAFGNVLTGENSNGGVYCTTENPLKVVNFGMTSAITRLGDEMFKCANVENLEMPVNAVTFGSQSSSSQVFALTTVNNLTIYTNNFSNTYPFSGLTAQNVTVKMGNSTSLNSIGLSGVVNLVVGEGITYIGLPGNDLRNVTIPSTLTDIANLTGVSKPIKNMSITFLHTVKPSFYSDTSWYDAATTTVSWPNITE